MLEQILSRRPAATMDDVIAIMNAVHVALPDSDGLKWFNLLYLRVTLAVRGAVSGATFGDPAFLERLDVVFANQYFDAAAAGDMNPAAAPHAWRPLFRSRHRRGVAPLQFALAGMNAHINRDLPDGIVATCQAAGAAPRDGDTRHADFLLVNGLLESVEAEVKTEFLTGAIAVLDVAAGQLDDTVAMWKVRAARDAAWTNAQVLWALGERPRLRNAFFERLDRLTGFAGRGLLLPCSVR
jgi:hypothetical protein